MWLTLAKVFYYQNHRLAEGVKEDIEMELVRIKLNKANADLQTTTP